MADLELEGCGHERYTPGCHVCEIMKVTADAMGRCPVCNNVAVMTCTDFVVKPDGLYYPSLIIRRGCPNHPVIPRKVPY